MAADLNSVSLIGGLTKDPELRALPNGMNVCEIRLAYTTSKKVGETWEDKSNYINVTVWGKQGEALARNLTRGQRIGVNGRLEHQEWTDKETGKTRETTKLIANSVQYLTPKGEAGAPAQTTAPATPAAAPVQSPVGPDDDIPFAPSVI